VLLSVLGLLRISSFLLILALTLCLQAGTQLAWLIDPKDESVLILKPQQFPELKSGPETLPVLESLSILELSAQELFGWLRLG
jgi:Uma2 family endonuclease